MPEGGRLGGPFLLRLEERNVGASSVSSLQVSPARKIPARESNAWHNAMEFKSYIKANGHLQSAESIAICVLVVYLSSANRRTFSRGHIERKGVADT